MTVFSIRDLSARVRVVFLNDFSGHGLSVMPLDESQKYPGSIAIDAAGVWGEDLFYYLFYYLFYPSCFLIFSR